MTLTSVTGIFSAAAIFSRILSIYGANFGLCAIIVESTFDIAYPFSSSTLATRRVSIRLSAPSYSGSLSGKSFPMSPSDAAPSRASIIACASTSASE